MSALSKSVTLDTHVVRRVFAKLEVLPSLIDVMNREWAKDGETPGEFSVGDTQEKELTMLHELFRV